MENINLKAILPFHLLFLVILNYAFFRYYSISKQEQILDTQRDLVSVLTQIFHYRLDNHICMAGIFFLFFFFTAEVVR